LQQHEKANRGNGEMNVCCENVKKARSISGTVAYLGQCSATFFHSRHT